MKALSVASVLLLSSSAAWTAVLATAGSDRSGVAVILLAVSLWLYTVVSVTGMLVARGRWARRLGLFVNAAQGGLALLIPPDLWWGAALILSGVTAISLGGPWLDGIIRARPSAAGPPTRAVLLPLVLIGTPYVLGMAGADEPAPFLLAASSLIAAFWFIRTLPGALSLVRVIWPAGSLAVAAQLDWPANVCAGLLAVTVATLAWHPSVRNAVYPLVESGSRVPIPPELAPREILDAANIDDRGKPR